MEKKGVVIKRPYSYEGKETYTLYKHQKHISLTLKGKIKDFFNSLGYRPSICVFDFYDVENYWITKLTVMGVSMYLTGNTTTAKYHAHEMWVARKMLLDGIGYEDKKQYEFEQFFEKTYGVKFELTFMPSDKESYIKYKNAIPDAIVSITPIKPAEEYVKKTLPELEDEVFRKEAYRVALEMDKFYSENYLNSKNTIAIAKEQKRLTTAAFKYIGEHYTGWWD